MEGRSVRALLKDPKAKWDPPAVTTFLRNNHAARSAKWRYIRYADGGEELYDHAADPLEHTNLAHKPEHADRKRELAKWLPEKNAPDLGPRRGGSRRGARGEGGDEGE